MVESGQMGIRIDFCYRLERDAGLDIERANGCARAGSYAIGNRLASNAVVDRGRYPRLGDVADLGEASELEK